jgi:hypothetical protein
MKARLAIQCHCPETGAEGSFLFTGESHRTPGSRVSPVFPGLVELFNWANSPECPFAEIEAGNAGSGFMVKRSH